jgi:hypothetical protein
VLHKKINSLHAELGKCRSNPFFSVGSRCSRTNKLQISPCRICRIKMVRKQTYLSVLTQSFCLILSKKFLLTGPKYNPHNRNKETNNQELHNELLVNIFMHCDMMLPCNKRWRGHGRQHTGGTNESKSTCAKGSFDPYDAIWLLLARKQTN